MRPHVCQLSSSTCQQSKAGRRRQSVRVARQTPPPRASAFTILEIMLAIFVFGLVLTAIYATWMGILKGTKIGLDAAAAVQRSRISMHALEDSLLTAQKFNANLRHYAFLADKQSMSLVARLPASFPGVGRYGDQIVRRVSFELRPGKDGLHELVMTQVPMLLDVDNSDVQPYRIVLAKEVSVFDLLFLPHNKDEWVDEWVEGPITNDLPRLVQITLGLGQAGNSARPQDVVTRIVALPSMAVMPDLQGFGGMPRGMGGLPPNLLPGAGGVPTVPPVAVPQ